MKTGPPCSPLRWTSGRSEGRDGPGRGLALPAGGPQRRPGDVCRSAPDAKLTGIRSVSVRSGAALRQDKASVPAAAHASGAPVSCSEVRRISAPRCGSLRERAGGRADFCVAVVVCAVGRAQRTSIYGRRAVDVKEPADVVVSRRREVLLPRCAATFFGIIGLILMSMCRAGMEGRRCWRVWVARTSWSCSCCSPSHPWFLIEEATLSTAFCPSPLYCPLLYSYWSRVACLCLFMSKRLQGSEFWSLVGQLGPARL